MSVARVTQSLARVPLPVWYVLAGGVGLYLAYRAVKGTAGLVGEGVKRATDAVGESLNSGLINPASPGNAWYRGVNQDLKWFGIIDDNSSLGSSIYDWFHPNQIDPTAPTPLPLSGHTKAGATWYGYDRAAADESARQAANSQIAKDVASYGGYGSLTR